MKSSLGLHRHLVASEMGSLLRREMPKAEAFLRVAHLHLCGECRKTFQQHWGERGRAFLDELNIDSPPWKEGDPAAPAAFAEWHSYFKEEEEAIDLLNILEQEQPDARLLAQPAYHKLGLARLLLTRCRESWHQRTKDSTNFAKFALVILGELDPSDYPRNLVRDTTALAWIFLAQSLRAHRRFDDAWRALRRAEIRMPESEEGAWSHATKAALFRDRRFFVKAIEHGEKAIKIFQDLGLKDEAIEIQASLGITLVETGDFETAIRSLRKTLVAWREGKGAPPPIAERTTLHNLAYSLALLGESFGAAKIQRDIRERFQRFDADKPYLQRRGRWLDALIAQGQGLGDKARRIFRELRDEYLGADLPYDAAFVALDLAVLCLNDGRTGEAAELALEIGPIFEAHGTDRESWMAFCILVDALKAETATVAHVQEVIEAMRAHQAADIPKP